MENTNSPPSLGFAGGSLDLDIGLPMRPDKTSYSLYVVTAGNGRLQRCHSWWFPGGSLDLEIGIPVRTSKTHMAVVHFSLRGGGIPLWWFPSGCLDLEIVPLLGGGAC